MSGRNFDSANCFFISRTFLHARDKTGRIDRVFTELSRLILVQKKLNPVKLSASCCTNLTALNASN